MELDFSKVDCPGGNSPPPDSMQAITSLFRRQHNSLLGDEQWRDTRMAVSAARLEARGMVRPSASLGDSLTARKTSSGSLTPDMFLFKEALSFSSIVHLSENWSKIIQKSTLPSCYLKHWESQWDRSFKRAHQIVLTLASQAFVYGYKCVGMNWSEQLLRWACLDMLGLAVKQLKLQTVVLSAIGRLQSYDSSDLVDKPGMLLSPAYCRWLIGRLRKSFRSTTSLAIAEDMLLGVKRGFVSAKDEQVDQSVVGLLQDLSRRKETNPLILDQIQRTCLELTGGQYLQLDRRANFRLSRRAGVEAPIALGGIEGDLLRREVGRLPIIPRDLIMMYERRVGQVREVRGFHVFSWGILMRYASEWKLSDRLAETEIQVIREPLKLRPITKGTPTLYGILKPYQVMEWDLLQREECFTLTGKESTSGAWAEPLSRSLPGDMPLLRLANGQWAKQPTANSWFISGDFKQSTNDVHMDCTTIATRTLWDPSDWLLIQKGLGAQRVRPAGCPSRWPEGAQEIIQSHGQLMGSPLSFPILCIINASIGRFAFELAYNRKFKLNECPMLINGDDFVARGDIGLYRWWNWLISEVGWQESLGKSFFSREFAQMNSQTRRPTWVPDCYGLPHCFFGDSLPYLNYGYLFSMKKCLEEQNEPGVLDAATRLREQWSSLSRLPKPWIRRAKVVYLQQLEILGHELKDVAQLPDDLSVWNSTEYGGFGLVPGVGDAMVGANFLNWRVKSQKPDLYSSIGEFGEDGGVDEIPDEKDPTSSLILEQKKLRRRYQEDRQAVAEGLASKGHVYKRWEKLFPRLNKRYRCLYERRVSSPTDPLAFVPVSKTYSLD